MRLGLPVRRRAWSWGTRACLRSSKDLGRQIDALTTTGTNAEAYVDDLKPSESEPPDGSTTATPEGAQSRDGREVLADLNPAPRGSGQLLLYG